MGKRCAGPLLDSQYRNTANARTFEDEATKLRFAVLTCPISMNSESCQGAIAMVTLYKNREHMASQLQELQTIISMAGTMALEVGTKKKTETKAVDTASASRAAGYQSLSEFAFAIVNNLKAKLGCESVSFGIVRKNRVNLLCMSGASYVDPHSIGTAQLEQVMEECLDAQEICCVQIQRERTDSISTVYMLHRDWHLSSGGSAVASLPLFVDDKCVAVLSLRHTPGQSFAPDQLVKVQELAAPLMPGALLLDRADRRLSEHVLAAVTGWLKTHLRTDTRTRRS